MNASPVAHNLSQSFAIRRLWEIQAKVRSTTHLLGNTPKPFGGINLCQFTAFPSLAHSSAQRLATSSGRGFLGLRTTSTLKPKTSSAHLLPLPW